jgi:hypothetical protein
MLDKIVIRDHLGNEGFYIYTDVIKPEQQKIKIDGICWRTGEPVDLEGQTLRYWKWFVWFHDYRMWINGVEWDKQEEQKIRDEFQRKLYPITITERQHGKDANMGEQRRKAWAKQEHDRIIDMGLDRSDADGNL